MPALAQLIGRGTLAARPAAGIAGQLYFATDGSGTMYRDNGATWDSVETTGGSSSVTTKGDLQGFSTVAARIPVGADTQVLTADSTQALGLKWAAAAGGGGGAPILPLDVAPGTAHAKDDEFPGSSLDAKWTNPGTSAAGQTLTVAVANGWLQFEPATAGSADTGKHVFFIRQVSPTGDFTVMAKIADGRAGDDCRTGIFVAKSTGKAYVLGSQRQNNRIANLDGVTTYSETADWSGYDGALDIYTAPGWPGAIWLKLVFAAGTLSAYYSASGIAWTLLGSQASVTQPDRFGLCLWANAATLILADHSLGADWFRVTEP